MEDCKDIQQFQQWLISRGIDTASWGAGAAKSVADLWAEVVGGETRIEGEPPLRVVQVVNVIIRNGDKVLIETEQQFGASQQRYRSTPLAEKMKPGEDYIDAALRGLVEELQVEPARVEIIHSSPEPRIILRESKSYPGLRTKYVIYTVEVKIAGLPDRDFWTYEGEGNSGDPVKRHQWRWV